MAFGSAPSNTPPAAGAFGSARTANPPSAGQFGAVSAAWTPAELFTASQDGFWYDPSDLSTVWQDAAGTVAGAVDSPVGRIDDKSGNGNYGFQNTASARPVLRQSGALYYLEFDNTDDFLQINSYRPTPSGVLCFSMGLTCTDTLGMFFSEEAIGGDFFYIFNSGSSNTATAEAATINGVWKDGSAATPITTRGNLYTHVIGANSLSAKVTLASDYETSAFRFSGYGGILAAGNYYGWVVSTDDWTADERTEVDAYMRAKKGV